MDRRLLQQLYIKYYKEIYLYLYSLCKNQYWTEDLVQETFLKALLSLPDGHTNMRAWLYMVGRNLYYNQAKRDSRLVWKDDFLDEEAGGQQDLLEDIFTDENQRLLYKALQHLDDRQREIIEMQCFGDLSQKEIAAILRMTLENVRVTVYRAKKCLKKYLEVHGYDIS